MPVSERPRRSQKQSQTIAGKIINHKMISWEQRLVNEKHGYKNAVKLGLV